MTPPTLIHPPPPPHRLLQPPQRKRIVVRCGNASAKRHANDVCHDTSNAHYGHVLHVSDIAWPAEEA